MSIEPSAQLKGGISSAAGRSSMASRVACARPKLPQETALVNMEEFNKRSCRLWLKNKTPAIDNVGVPLKGLSWALRYRQKRRGVASFFSQLPFRAAKVPFLSRGGEIAVRHLRGEVRPDLPRTSGRRTPDLLNPNYESPPNNRANSVLLSNRLGLYSPVVGCCVGLWGHDRLTSSPEFCPHRLSQLLYRRPLPFAFT